MSRYAKDFYTSLEELKAEQKEGKHFRVLVLNRQSSITIVAPHGGYIEPGSSYLARAIAREDFNLYDFQGLRRWKAEKLHITSTRFRDGPLLELLEASRLALSLHSMGTIGRGEIWIGGLHALGKEAMADHLSERGFRVNLQAPFYKGQSPRNFVNLPREHGVQLELSGDVMRSLFQWHKPLFDASTELSELSLLSMPSRGNARMINFLEGVRLALAVPVSPLLVPTKEHR